MAITKDKNIFSLFEKSYWQYFLDLEEQFLHFGLAKNTYSVGESGVTARSPLIVSKIAKWSAGSAYAFLARR